VIDGPIKPGLGPCSPHLPARFAARLDANEWVRFDWPDPPLGL
jgi:hypothetical protein